MGCLPRDFWTARLRHATRMERITVGLVGLRTAEVAARAPHGGTRRLSRLDVNRRANGCEGAGRACAGRWSASAGLHGIPEA